MYRSRDWRRKMDYSKALRKKNISDQWTAFSLFNSSYYPELHMYSKGKIHCSCPMCSCKSKNKGKRKRGNYQLTYNWSIKDRNKIYRLADEELEYFEED